MRIIIDPKEFADNSEQKVRVLRLLCLLEYSLSSMNWHAGSLIERSDLPSQESIIALSFHLSSLCEALDRFHEFADKGYLGKNPTWGAQVLDDWDVLISEEVRNFRYNCLKTLRDKAVAHVDDKAIRSYIDTVRDNGEEIVVFEAHESDKRGFSPLGAQFIYIWMESNGLVTADSARLSQRIYKSLQKIVQTLIMEFYPNCKIED